MSSHTARQSRDIANTRQNAAWNGPEAANWAASSDPAGAADDGLVLPLLHAAALAETDHVLDIGCGTGEMTRLAAGRAAHGRALGVDLSNLMVDIARQRAVHEGVVNAQFEVGDVQTYPFTPSAFDVAVSHFGAMFFNDPVAAFHNVAEALRPGGRLVLVCPQAMERCDWYVGPLSALLGHAPTMTEAPSQMFSLAKPARVQAVLGNAGFVDIRLEPQDAALRFGPDAESAAKFYVGSGPVRAFLERRPDVAAEQAESILVSAVAPYLSEDGIRIPGRHWLVTAHRPS